MKIREARFSLPPLDSSGRSAGLHLSSIIKDMLRHMDPDRFGGECDDAVEKRWELGFMWEEVLGDAMSRRGHRTRGRSHRASRLLQHEIELDNIFMTPDCFDFIRWVLEEYKATWMSANAAINDPKFWHWMVQIKAYSYALQTRRADLYVFFVNGTYRRFGPVAKKFELKFTKAELEQNWSMVRRHRDRMLRMLRRKKVA